MTNQSNSTKNSILTFGYGNRKDYDAFLSYIEEFNIAYVIDVRLSPRAWTRRWYGCAIEELCASKNIRYISKASLGNISGSHYWIPPKKDEVEESLLEVAEVLETGNVLLLCAEMDSSRCHRTEVANKLQKITSAPIKHLK
ncbi:DUF488 domain-containing protein [Tumidithrix elongata RA019]|uniref:DUF488 domain-containing protein n=1 Tax=Tumidithrix elongata BACA0141 TaxID=2716417 RepID=A0AAW9Q3Q0_9CYAN|nr:DUF488 domain-containing protein [Tumidithrix elongata RA019]